MPALSPSRPASSFPLWKGLLCAAGLLVVVFLVYQPVWNGKFIWDDGFLVAGNSFIRSPWLLLECFRHFLFADAATHFYRPVQNWSYFLDYWRGGLDPAIYHQTNILIHGLNAALLFVLVRRWLAAIGGIGGIGAMSDGSSSAAWGGLAVAFLWAVHPVHSATVAYVSGRADSLALLFFLAGWWFWEKGAETQAKIRWLFFALAMLCGLLATCSKEIAAEALLLFLLHLWLVRTELTRKLRIGSSAGTFVLFIAYLLLRSLPQADTVVSHSPTFTPVERIGMFFRAIGDYFRLLVWPDRLYMERQIIDQPALLRHPTDFDPMFPWLGWLGGIFLALLLGAVLWKAEGRRLRILGAMWFLVMILPVSNLFSLNASVAEHWLYFPSIGFLLCLAGCWKGWRMGKPATVLLVLLAVTGLGMRAWLRACDWPDPFTFYQATIRDGGDSVRMRINLASEYKKRGQLPEVERLYRSVLTRMPSYIWVQNLLADNLRSQGRVAEADAILKEIPPDTTGELKDRAAYIQQLIRAGRLDEAYLTVHLLYEQHPDSWPAASLFAEILGKQNRPDAAILVLQSYAQRHWWHLESHQLLGQLLVAAGRSEEAIAAWQQVAGLDIHDGQAYSLIAALLADLGKFDRAIEFQKLAVKRHPTQTSWIALAEICRDGHDPVGEAEARRKAAAMTSSANPVDR